MRKTYTSKLPTRTLTWTHLSRPLQRPQNVGNCVLICHCENTPVENSLFPYIARCRARWYQTLLQMMLSWCTKKLTWSRASDTPHQHPLCSISHHRQCPTHHCSSWPQHGLPMCSYDWYHWAVLQAWELHIWYVHVCMLNDSIWTRIS